MPYDFPTTPTTGTVVTVPDGSYRVWDSQKWRASPSANVIIPPTGFLPLTGGNVSGMVSFGETAGAISINRNIAWTGFAADLANQPLMVTHTFSGTALDVAGPVYGTKIIQNYLGFNNGALGARGNLIQTRIGPGSIGQSFSGLYFSAAQYTDALTNTTWAANTVYATNNGVTSNGLHYKAVVGGTSGTTGPSGLGSSITDGSVVWQYNGPGVVSYWQPFTNYPNKGALAINPNNGGLYRVEIAGTSGANPGPTIGPPSPIMDGTVGWSRHGYGTQSTSVIGLAGTGQASFNAGGVSFDDPVGTYWGAVLGAVGVANATYYHAVVGLEVDDNWAVPARRIVNTQIIKQGAQGFYTDVALLIGTRPNPIARARNALIFQDAIDHNLGYGISFENQSGGGLQHMAGCIDLRLVVADGASGPFGNGFLVRTPNGKLDNNGAWQMRYGSITPTASGLSIDVPNVELQSLAVTAGGTNWRVNAYWRGSDGSYGQVATITGAGPLGPMATVSILIPSQVAGPAGSATVTLNFVNPDDPADSSTTTPIVGTIGPRGAPIIPTTATATATYAAPASPTLSLMPSGGATVFGGPVSVPGQISVPAGGSIQAAHDALPSTGGSILLAANTVFDATSTVTISKNNVRLSGPSWATIVRRNASFTSGVLINVTGSGCTVENFTVDGNAVVTSVGELNANGNNSLVRNMQIMNSKGTIHLALSGNNSRATGNTIAGPGVDLGIQTGYGIWAANHNTVMIDHNVITGTCIDGIGVDGNGTQVIGNRVSGCHCYAASSGGQIATYPGAGTGNGVIIMGNTVGTGGSLQAHGIEVDGTNEVVSGNVVDTVQGYGILVVGNGAVITGNILRNIGQLPGSIDGIAVRPNVSDFVISGNRIIDDQGTPTMRFAISVAAGTSDNYAITGNRIMSGVNSTQPTSDAGTGLHKVVDNNAGLNDLVRSVAATGTFTVPPTPTIQITGSGTVTAVNGSLFTGRQGMLIPTGATVFTAGATIGNTVTCTPNVPLNFVFDGTKLYLH